MKNRKIPKFKSYKEEAKFWDTHDITDYLEEMESVKAEIALKKPKNEVLTLRIQPELKKRLIGVAHNYGINLSTLARIWLIDKLKEKDNKVAFS